MADILKYGILNPVSNRKEPYYDAKSKLLVIPIKHNFKYYVEVVDITREHGKRYMLLLGANKFNENARRCNTDQWGRCRIPVKGELQQYLIDESERRGNISVVYLESNDDYDVFIVE